MILLVPIRSSPDWENLSVSQSQGRVFERGKRRLHPDSARAVEAALRDKSGDVVAAMIGTEADADAVKTALAMGCDRALLVIDEAAESWDGFVKANLLAALAKRIGAERILAGPEDEAALRLSPATAPADLTPRLPNALAIMKASKKPVERVTPSDLGVAGDDLVPRYVQRAGYLA